MIEINGTSFGLELGFRPQILLSLDWMRSGDGCMYARDRGQAEDVHRVEITIRGTYSEMETLQSEIDSDREKVVVTADATTAPIFGPHIDYSSMSNSLDCVLESHGNMKRIGLDAWSMDLTLRLIEAPTYISDSVSTTTLKNDLYSLKSVPINGPEVMTSFNINPRQMYTRTGNVTHDHDTDIGLAKFSVTDYRNEKMGRILKALITVLRGSYTGWPATGQSPADWAVAEPFGPRSPSLANVVVKIPKWNLAAKNLQLGWTLELEFAQHFFVHGQ